MPKALYFFIIDVHIYTTCFRDPSNCILKERTDIFDEVNLYVPEVIGFGFIDEYNGKNIQKDVDVSCKIPIDTAAAADHVIMPPVFSEPDFLFVLAMDFDDPLPASALDARIISRPPAASPAEYPRIRPLLLFGLSCNAAPRRTSAGIRNESLDPILTFTLDAIFTFLSNAAASDEAGEVVSELFLEVDPEPDPDSGRCI